MSVHLHDSDWQEVSDFGLQQASVVAYGDRGEILGSNINDRDPAVGLRSNSGYLSQVISTALAAIGDGGILIESAGSH